MYNRPSMRAAMIAGKMEKSNHIIWLTASASVMVITVCPAASVPEMNPEKPRNRATNEPLMAVPNFMAMVPEEKMTPVEDVPFFSVA